MKKQIWICIAACVIASMDNRQFNVDDTLTEEEYNNLSEEDKENFELREVDEQQEEADLAQVDQPTAENNSAN